MTAADGSSALAQAEKHRPHLVVLDVMMPDMDGFEVTRKLRERGRDVPVLFLTARDDVEDKVTGLTVGGDDYVTKPFSLEEVVARIRAVLRRTGAVADGVGNVLAFADLELDEDAHEVRRGGRVVDLSPTEFKLLRYLLLNPNRVLSKAQILDHVWDYDFGGDGAIVESYISYLRRKIDADAAAAHPHQARRRLRAAPAAPWLSRPPRPRRRRRAAGTDDWLVAAAGRRRAAARLRRQPRVPARGHRRARRHRRDVGRRLGARRRPEPAAGQQVNAQLRATAPSVARDTAAELARSPEPGRTVSVVADLPSEYVMVVYVEALDATVEVRPAVRSAEGVPRVPEVTGAQAAARGREPFTVGSREGTGRWQVLSLPTADRGASVSVALPLDADDATKRLTVVTLIIGSAVVGMAALLGGLAVRRSLRALTAVEHTAVAIARGELSARVPEGGQDTEVGRLTRALNGMLARIEDSIRQRDASQDRMRRFVADASHELRTPLASIRGFAELHRQGAVPPEEVAPTFARIEAEARRLGCSSRTCCCWPSSTSSGRCSAATSTSPPWSWTPAATCARWTPPAG